MCFKTLDASQRIKMSQYFPKQYEHSMEILMLKLIFQIMQQRQTLKIFNMLIHECFTLKTNLANSKTEVDKLDIGKLVPVSVDLSKLSDVVTNDVVKKIVYDKLVAKVDSIDTSKFVLKTKYNTDKSELENKILDTSGLVKKNKL